MSATTISMTCSSPAPVQTSADARPMPGSAIFALVAAWVLFGAALCLPTVSGFVGIRFVLGMASQLIIGCTGDIGALVVGSSFLPNLAIFLSPLLLVPMVRRSRLISLFRMMGALSVLVALLFAVMFGSTDGGIGIGYLAWILSLVFLSFAISNVSSAQKRA